MPWFYAGPEAKPVGPVSVEQLHANRVNGTISPDTYVIEQTGQPGATMTWRRYREAFPDSPPRSCPERMWRIRSRRSRPLIPRPSNAQPTAFAPGDSGWG